MASEFVPWFRNASPYINAHRGKTFVLQVRGEILGRPLFAHLVHDIALLNTLGVRVVLVHGIRPQIDVRLAAQQITPIFQGALRITDDAALVAAKEAAGTVRVELEARLSMGLANSPMAGQALRVTSGNFLKAKPIGVRDGVDYQHTGEVRKVDVPGMQELLAQGSIVLVTPIGFSLTGEAFNLGSEDVATDIAIALGADKLVFLGEFADEPVCSTRRHMSLAEATDSLDTQSATVSRYIANALRACRRGVSRTHLLDESVDGALLMELFSRDGCGLMINADSYERFREASIDDVPGILELIEPLEDDGILLRRPREKLEQEVANFTVVERDHAVIACAALYPLGEPGVLELACLAVHDDYRGTGTGERLLEHLLDESTRRGARRLIVLTTHTAQWFKERGFNDGTPDDLPNDRKASYNSQRNSKVLVRELGDIA